MNTQHTPGPWTAEATTSSEFVTRAIHGPDRVLIAHVGLPGYDNVHTDVANARLIAAAPALAALLRELLADAEEACFPSAIELTHLDGEEWTERARAALRAAGLID